MGFPKVSVIFKSIASNAIKRGDSGVVALILRDAVAGVHKLGSVAEMPELSAVNQKYIQDAFIGGIKSPSKVIVVVIPAAEEAIASGLVILEKHNFNYVCVPGGAEADQTALATWVKSMREKAKRIKAVVANVAADSEGVVNFATDNIIVGENTYTASEYVARIAGVIAGTPMNTSITFLSLPEVDDVPMLSDEDKDTAIQAGKLILVNDGRKVKIARGVNSLVSLTEDKNEQFKKIKIVDIIDLVHDDVKHTAEDSYIGKVSNSYDNACLLISAINGYFGELEGQGLLGQGMNHCAYDVDAKVAFLKQIGKYKDGMKEIEIKEAPSGDKVFLKAAIAPLDVMEEIQIVIAL